jgi:hypothetical protein
MTPIGLPSASSTPPPLDSLLSPHDSAFRRIAFVGSRGFADFYGIGGMQSYIRRLGRELAARGHQVDYLVHEAGVPREVTPFPGVRIRYVPSLQESLAILSSGNYSDVVRVWFAGADRFGYLRHVMGAAPGRHHYLWFVVSDSPAKWLFGMFEGLASARHGRFYCVSPRQLRAAKRWTGDARLLLPPVPRAYYLSPEQKSVGPALRLTYLGVIHPDKGLLEVMRLFGALRGDPRFSCSIHATHDPHDVAQVELHQRLLRDETVHYVPMTPSPWSPELDAHVRAVLAETDVFVQPFQSLRNTVDTPLLMLEAMASLCVMVTTPLQSIPELYGNRRFLLPAEGWMESALSLLRGMDESTLRAERERLYRRNQELAFSEAEVADRFLADSAIPASVGR